MNSLPTHSLSLEERSPECGKREPSEGSLAVIWKRPRLETNSSIEESTGSNVTDLTPVASDDELDYFSASDLCHHPSFPSQQVRSLLKIAKIPLYQMLPTDFSRPSREKQLPYTSSTSFADWSAIQQEESVDKLMRLGIPLRGDLLKKVYSLLKNHTMALCLNRETNYPALHKIEGAYQKPGSSVPFEKIHFEIQIDSDTRASLLFRETPETLIDKGSYKSVRKGYSLGHPSLLAYLFTDPELRAQNDQEEYCFREFKDAPSIAKAHQIFHYATFKPVESIQRVKKCWLEQHVIEMEYYPSTLFQVMKNQSTKALSYQRKLLFSFHLMRAIAALHAKEIVHRDIKPENILVNEKGGFLTDFGLSISAEDIASDALGGTYSYFSPEEWARDYDSLGFPVDIWAAGNTLWSLWFPETILPWIPALGMKSKLTDNAEFILERMIEFQLGSGDTRSPIEILLRQMLSFKPEQRPSAGQVLNALEAFQNQA